MRKIRFKEDERPAIRSNQKMLMNLHLKVFLVASLIERPSRGAESVAVVPNESATSKIGNFPTAIGQKAKLLVPAMLPEP